MQAAVMSATPGESDAPQGVRTTDPNAARPPDPGPAREPVPHHVIAEAVSRAMHSHLAEHLSQVEEMLAAHARDVAASGRRHLDQAARVCVPAWQRVTDGEARWPVMLVVLIAIGLQAAIPHTYAVPPRWLLPALELALLTVLTAANPRRVNVERRWLRVTGLILVAVASLANMYAAAQLVWRLVHGQEDADAGPLLAIGAAIWITNVIIFALWYWEFDRGGPAARAHARDPYPDFQFPQMLTPDAGHEDWEPTFIDYLYLSFTNATAFSPTDTMPMTRWAKVMMMTQSTVSLATVALVIARAVNILK
jgi:uncharacterized membrane protein